jgi:transmembrane sensor
MHMGFKVSTCYFMDKNKIEYLLKRYGENKATKDEVNELFGLLKHAEGDEILKKLIVGAKEDQRLDRNISEEEWNRIWNTITDATTGGRKNFFSMRWVRVAAAAAMLVVIVYSAYLLHNKKNIQQPVVATNYNKPYKNDIAPGGNKAVLTLANGSTIILDSSHNGVLAQQGNVQVIKLDGALAYNRESSRENNETEIQYNVLSTPRGGQYQITLPDETKVWLNAASSLRFPTIFAGKQRVVELTGEAFFEVKHNPSMPFHVKVNNIDIEDVGTQFNVMAYENEQSVKTTLLEGKVNVSRNSLTKSLVPGKQAIANKEMQSLDVKDANVEQAVAWKNGYFRFKETNIHELMRQVERWYDVDVEFKTQGDEQDYTGIVPRTQNVSALLHTLELTETVHFEIEGRKIIVKP